MHPLMQNFLSPVDDEQPLAAETASPAPFLANAAYFAMSGTVNNDASELMVL